MRFICLFFVVAALLEAMPGKETDKQTLNVLAYDSFIAEWGIGPRIEELFEQEYDCDVVYINGGDAVATLHLAARYTEDDPNRPDVIIGIDNNMLSLAEALSVLREVPIAGQKHSDPAADVLPDYLVPFDYGYFAIIYDADTITRAPRSLSDLTDARFKDSLILMHPGSSSPGLSFLYWSIAAFGEPGFLSYWEALQASILTVTDSWEAGYGMFSAQEAPLVLSYTTSPAYHIAFEQEDRYKAAIFPKGHYIQVEGAGISAYAQDPELAESFVLFLQEASVQEEIPLKNFMYPVRSDVSLPPSYQGLGHVSRRVHLSQDDIRLKGSEWLESWNQLMSR